MLEIKSDNDFRSKINIVLLLSFLIIISPISKFSKETESTLFCKAVISSLGSLLSITNFINYILYCSIYYNMCISLYIYTLLNNKYAK